MKNNVCYIDDFDMEIQSDELNDIGYSLCGGTYTEEMIERAKAICDRIFGRTVIKKEQEN